MVSSAIVSSLNLTAAWAVRRRFARPAHLLAHRLRGRHLSLDQFENRNDGVAVHGA
jgi:hypothetical protein